MQKVYYSCLFGLIFSLGSPVLAQDETLFNKHLATVLESFFSIKGQLPQFWTLQEKIEENWKKQSSTINVLGVTLNWKNNYGGGSTIYAGAL